MRRPVLTLTLVATCLAAPLTASIGLATPAHAATGPAIEAFVVKKNFHPVRDGFADSIYATVTSSEQGVARLVVYRGAKTVSVGLPTNVQPGFPTPVLSRTGLKPGRYTVAIDLRDAAGNRTLSPRRPAVGDSLRLVAVPTKLTLTPSTAAYTDRSGSCSQVSLSSNTSVKLDTNSRCKASSSDAASATARVDYDPPIVTPLTVPSSPFGVAPRPLQLVKNLSVTVHYSGGAITGALLSSQGSQEASDTGSGGTLTLHVAAPDTGTDGRLQLQLSTTPGRDSTITAISLSYQRKVLK